MSDRKRLLEELRVIDLRAELEKRSLDKSGIRSVLIQRLSKYLEEQGEDPSTYKFELGADCKTPSKRTRRTESSIEPDSEDTPAMEDMIVQDAAEDEEIESEKNTSLETKDEEKMEVEENEKSNRKRESTDDCEPTPAKKPCLAQEEKDVKQEEDHKGENNTDAEDSINLDLGDDELLNEETDNNATKIKKDDEHHENTAADGSSDPAPKDGESADAASSENQVNNEATTNSHDDNRKESRNKDDKDKEGDDKKDKKDESKEGGARNLWVSGLSSDTRAKDLKQLCSKHGKVIGAKVVTNARTPGSRCYGYVTMATAQDAENCIKNLHRTELHGRMISVEKAKSESESSSRRQPVVRSERRPSKDKKDEATKEDGKDNGTESKAKKDGDVSGAESARSTSRTREKSHRSEKDKAKRSTRSRERRRSPREVLSFSKIWKERDEARARERSRAAREDERRRRAAEEALRERERRQRQEKHRLNMEREKLRAEREKIEREKNELLRLERERHRLEREKLELERLELKRAQQRLEEERRKRGYDGAYRKPASSPPPEPAYERERHKRAPPPQMVRTMTSSRGQFEAPPPPRFELAGGYERGDKRDRDYKRDYPRHVPSNNMKYPNNGSANDDARQPIPPGTRPKEPSRTYESRDGRSYRPSPPAKPEPRNWSASNRYPDAAQPKAGGGSGASNTEWSGETRYAGGGAQYEPRYGAYQPPPPGATYPDRYAPQARDYSRKY